MEVQVLGGEVKRDLGVEIGAETVKASDSCLQRSEGLLHIHWQVFVLCDSGGQD